MILDGKTVAEKIQHEIREKVAAIAGRKPCLVVVLVGDNPASRIYVKRKKEACEAVGMISILKEFPSTISEKDLTQEVENLNSDHTVDGILVQLPLPRSINPEAVINTISPKKDVDGFHPFNVGKLSIGDTDGFCPCTPLGIKTLLEKNQIDVTGKHVVIVGRSNIVGKPMAALLMQNQAFGNATITIAHRYTKEIEKHTQMADILIVAVGTPRFITKEMVKQGAVVIDVGINRLGKNKIVGDVDFESVKEKVSLITPVPGGVGPMTIAMLLHNTLKSYQNA